MLYLLCRVLIQTASANKGMGLIDFPGSLKWIADSYSCMYSVSRHPHIDYTRPGTSLTLANASDVNLSRRLAKSPRKALNVHKLEIVTYVQTLIK